MSNEFGILELNILYTAMCDKVEEARSERDRYGEDTLGTVEKYTELRDKVHTMLEAKFDEADKAFKNLRADRLKRESEKVKGKPEYGTDFGFLEEGERFLISILD